GGAVLTNDPELARRLKLFRSHGIERDRSRFKGGEATESGETKPWLSEQQVLGFNYRMSELSAALGLSQLNKLDRFLERRREIVRRYDEAFAKLSPISLPQSASDQRARSGHHLYIAVFDFAAIRTTRTAFMQRLADRGIGSQVHYMPVYHHPLHAQRSKVDGGQYPNAERYYGGCLSLPLHPGLTDEEVERVIGAVCDLVTSA